MTHEYFARNNPYPATELINLNEASLNFNDIFYSGTIRLKQALNLKKGEPIFS